MTDVSLVKLPSDECNLILLLISQHWFRIIMALCRKATSQHLSQCWPRPMSPYGVTRPQWVKPYPKNKILQIFTDITNVIFIHVFPRCQSTGTDLYHCWQRSMEIYAMTRPWCVKNRFTKKLSKAYETNTACTTPWIIQIEKHKPVTALSEIHVDKWKTMKYIPKHAK